MDCWTPQRVSRCDDCQSAEAGLVHFVRLGVPLVVLMLVTLSFLLAQRYDL